jgi:hypothetical protein
MVLPLVLSLAALSGAPPPPQPHPRPPAVISTGKEVALKERLAPEQPTVVVFLRPASSVERSFLSDLQQSAGDRVAFAVVQLKSGEEPVARQYEIKETPTALVYDRRGRLVKRSSDAGEISAAVHHAAQVMRIDWAEAGDARLEEATRVLGRDPGRGILRTMSFQPEYLCYINELSRKAHFSDGYLDRRTKEMIATYVSALNKCKY